MSHPEELIHSILFKLKDEYPPSEFSYVIEKAIPGTRMMPDILIVDRAGKHCCAVEIGYTRPEKLTAYRKELLIPDVRWYDKKGNLHADVEERVIKYRIESTPTGVFYVYFVMGRVPCHSEMCIPFTPGQTDEEYDTEMDERYESVYSALVTDRTKFLLPSFCDKCGRKWMADTTLDGPVLIEYQGTPREIGRAHGAPEFRGSWDDALVVLREHFDDDLDIEYGDAEFIHSETKAQLITTFVRDRALEQI